jgi:hypothetical protein
MAQTFIAIAFCAAIITSLAASCEVDTDCESDEFCGCTTNGATDMYNLPKVCQKYSKPGEACGGFSLCPSRCGNSMTCQDHQSDPWVPQLADAPGICCQPTDCKSPPSTRQVVDEDGCLTCACELLPCEGQGPVLDGAFAVRCGDGTDCGEGQYCDVDNSVCCTSTITSSGTPSSASSTYSSSSVPEEDDNTASGAGIPGGKIIAEPEDEHIIAAASCAFTQISETLSMENANYVIEAATKQVVSGLRIELTLLVTGEATLIGSLNGMASSSVEARYEVAVWLQPWRTPACQSVDFEQVYFGQRRSTSTPSVSSTPSTAESSTSTSGIPGGARLVDPSHEQVQTAAACALAVWLEESGYEEYEYHVATATIQVVAGIKVEFTMDIITTDIENDSLPVRHTRRYEVDVLLQAWLNPGCTVNAMNLVDEHTDDVQEVPATETEWLDSSSSVEPEEWDPVPQALQCLSDQIVDDFDLVYSRPVFRVMGTPQKQLVSGIVVHLTLDTSWEINCNGEHFRRESEDGEEIESEDGDDEDLLHAYCERVDSPAAIEAATEMSASVWLQIWLENPCSSITYDMTDDAQPVAVESAVAALVDQEEASIYYLFNVFALVAFVVSCVVFLAFLMYRGRRTRVVHIAASPSFTGRRFSEADSFSTLPPYDDADTHDKAVLLKQSAY